MTNKKRALAAIRSLLRRYREALTNSKLAWVICYQEECPLCKIFFKEDAVDQCKGCPLGFHIAGCTDYVSLDILSRAVKTFTSDMCEYDSVKLALKGRIAFWEKAYWIINSWPESRFTINGCKDQRSEIPLEW